MIQKFSGPRTIAAGLLGGLSLAFMQIIKSMGQAQDFAQSSLDEMNIGMATGQSPESGGETRILTCLDSGASQLAVESGFDIVPDKCRGGTKINFESAFFCSSGNPSRSIVFSRPFLAPPTIIITISGASANSSLLPCTEGAMDQVGHTYSNLTSAGFYGDAWVSPASTSTPCTPYTSFRGPIKFNWYAIGYR